MQNTIVTGLFSIGAALIGVAGGFGIARFQMDNDPQPDPVTSYVLEIDTADEYAAGTDSQLFFDLIDAKGLIIATLSTDGGAGDDDNDFEEATKEVLRTTETFSQVPVAIGLRMKPEGSGINWRPAGIALHMAGFDRKACIPPDRLDWLTVKKRHIEPIQLRDC